MKITLTKMPGFGDKDAKKRLNEEEYKMSKHLDISQFYYLLDRIHRLEYAMDELQYYTQQLETRLTESSEPKKPKKENTKDVEEKRKPKKVKEPPDPFMDEIINTEWGTMTRREYIRINEYWKHYRETYGM